MQLLELKAHDRPPTFQLALQLCHLSLQGLVGFQELTSLLLSLAQLHANLQQMPRSGADEVEGQGRETSQGMSCPRDNLSGRQASQKHCRQHPNKHYMSLERMQRGMLLAALAGLPHAGLCSAESCVQTVRLQPPGPSLQCCSL